MRRVLRTTMISLVLGVFLLGGAAMAASSGYKELPYGEFTLNCYISCSSSTGVAKTKGGMTDNKNRAAITIYNADGVSVGNNVNIPDVPDEAVASASKIGKVYSALSCHSLVRVLDDTHVYPLYMQATRTATR